MEEIRIDGASVVKETKPSEQGSYAQIQTADGLVVQQSGIEECSMQPTETIKGGIKETPKKEYKPDYSESKKEELAKVTKVGEEELLRIVSELGDIVSLFDKENVTVNLTEYIRRGGDIVTPVVNREHGKDQISTGESILTYGAQRQLLFITAKMAKADGMGITRFKNDKSDNPISDDALVILDGNGRMNFLFGLEDSKLWPKLYATYIVKDSLGYYNPRKAMEVINTERCMWKTQDMVQKRQLEDGNQAHEGWGFIGSLVNSRGYNYQAACQIATLATDRIKKGAVTDGNADTIFCHFESAKTIHKALVAKFGEGDDKTLKTKEFTKEISTLWIKLQRKGGDEFATKHFVKFIEGLKDTKVKEIKEAKSVKSGLRKDDIRKNILNEQFNQFIGKENIEID